jgi:nucleotidyltransferase substrate binding protein (TIGR01987 family)
MSSANKEPLNLVVFDKAVKSLGDALREYAKDNTNTYVRDSCIQRFEYCYDLSTKMIRRFLSNISEVSSQIHAMDFADIIRLGYTRGILKNSWDIWWEYRANRNATSHGYDEKRAIDIVAKLDLFYVEVLFLLDMLTVRNDPKF